MRSKYRQELKKKKKKFTTVSQDNYTHQKISPNTEDIQVATKILAMKTWFSLHLHRNTRKITITSPYRYMRFSYVLLKIFGM